MSFTLRFSGHETFALRYGWLNKSYNSLDYKEKNEENLVVDLGVGKNMVNSIKYWTEISGLQPLKVSDQKKRYISDITKVIKLHDSYLEKPVSNWLLHYYIQKNYSELTFARWYFNFSNKQFFDKNDLILDLMDWLNTENLKIPALATLQKDFDCFALCYGKKLSKTFKGEDSFISPLNELGLLYHLEANKFKSDFTEQKSLKPEVFLYCLVDFWQTFFKNTSTISVDSILTMPGSPGRLFRINNIGIDFYLNQCSLLDERFFWSDTLGIRSLACKDIQAFDLDNLLEKIYSESE
ncbi:DUF4007 family protein [Acinetobacter sp. ANC 5414]|uniref:DUF4007 family protein n=1 Tax=Acinetobacter sp. ANC 5414 TaxID=2731251 RepID=UPI00148FDF6E|nr:DUF4007 family protein [Acinetobacter sp. ANC 5414]NNH00809.1 DUF4007 family protein [Acinetobacter sp. ANC 5414]